MGRTNKAVMGDTNQGPKSEDAARVDSRVVSYRPLGENPPSEPSPGLADGPASASFFNEETNE
jgi:hypothetical protein